MRAILIGDTSGLQNRVRNGRCCLRLTARLYTISHLQRKDVRKKCCEWLTRELNSGYRLAVFDERPRHPGSVVGDADATLAVEDDQT